MVHYLVKVRKSWILCLWVGSDGAPEGNFPDLVKFSGADAACDRLAKTILGDRQNPSKIFK